MIKNIKYKEDLKTEQNNKKTLKSPGQISPVADDAGVIADFPSLTLRIRYVSVTAGNLLQLCVSYIMA